jgi:hypothetical protein
MSTKLLNTGPPEPKNVAPAQQQPGGRPNRRAHRRQQTAPNNPLRCGSRQVQGLLAIRSALPLAVWNRFRKTLTGQEVRHE